MKMWSYRVNGKGSARVTAAAAPICVSTIVAKAGGIGASQDESGGCDEALHSSTKVAKGEVRDLI